MNHSLTIKLTYHWKDCPYTFDDIGKQVEKPLEDDYGITMFYGLGYIEQITIMGKQSSDGKDTTLVTIRCLVQ